jgi:hypothetical protein
VDVDDGCGERLRTRKDRLGDFFEFVLEVGEVVVLPEAGKFFEVDGAGKTGSVRFVDDAL